MILFGYDDRDVRQPRLLDPFPLASSTMSQAEAAGLNEWVAAKLKPEMLWTHEIEQVGEAWRFHSLTYPALRDIAHYLSPYLRHEIGYALRILSNDYGGKREVTASDQLREALQNTADMFLLSVGVDWHIRDAYKPHIKRAYDIHFSSILGPRPRQPHRDIRGLDGVLRALNNAQSIKMTNDWEDIANMGHGLEYMMQKTGQRGGEVEIVAMPDPLPPNVGTPVRASFFGMRIR